MPLNWAGDVPADPDDYLPDPGGRVQPPPAPIAADAVHTEAGDSVVGDAPPLQPPDVSLNLVTALSAKGFVILTGPSGTGKSRVVLDLAQALERLPDAPADSSTLGLIPVGADWTDTRSLLGFKNPFGRERETDEGGATNESYDVTQALRLLIRAADPDRADVPHFLLLDEMNLSHVERYFSPFLSVLEARRAAANPSDIALLPPETMAVIRDVIHDSEPNTPEDVAATKLNSSGRGLPLSSNLFVIGTVNVDETTYMFSPKVLDRAHVIELLSVLPSSYINGTDTSDDELIPGEMARAILRGAMELHAQGVVERKKPGEVLADAEARFKIPQATASAILTGTTRALDGVYSLLEPVGFAFGFRVINEVFEYVYFWCHAQSMRMPDDATAFDSWATALDRAIVQKVLPKIHGNRRQLGGSLAAVEAFLRGNDRDGSPPARYQNADGPEVAIATAAKLDPAIAASLWRSQSKVQRMIQRLAGTGYVSYVQ